MPRQWLANVIYSVAGQPFADWVDEVIASRNSKIAANEKKHILMDPEVFAAFEASTQVSSKFRPFLRFLTSLSVRIAVNGRGVDMLKAGTKRRRTKAEMEEFKLEQILKEEEEQNLRRRVAVLEQKVA